MTQSEKWVQYENGGSGGIFILINVLDATGS